PLLARSAGRRQRQRAGEVAQVERVLHRVEAEGLVRERAVGQPAQEGMREDRRVDRLDRAPERPREGPGESILRGPRERDPACILDGAMDHRLDAEQVHYEWNNALPPRLEVEPGDTVVFDTRDAADRYYRPTSTHADVLARGPFRGHPLTGPVRVRGAGARRGNVVMVETLEVKPAEFGWPALRPGRGLLPESDFDKPFLQIWDLSDGTHARAGGRIAVPMAPF